MSGYEDSFFQTGRNSAEARFWKLKIHEEDRRGTKSSIAFNRDAEDVEKTQTYEEESNKAEGTEANEKDREKSSSPGLQDYKHNVQDTKPTSQNTKDYQYAPSQTGYSKDYQYSYAPSQTDNLQEKPNGYSHSKKENSKDFQYTVGPSNRKNSSDDQHSYAPSQIDDSKDYHYSYAPSETADSKDYQYHYSYPNRDRSMSIVSTVSTRMNQFTANKDYQYSYPGELEEEEESDEATTERNYEIKNIKQIEEQKKKKIFAEERYFVKEGVNNMTTIKENQLQQFTDHISSRFY